MQCKISAEIDYERVREDLLEVERLLDKKVEELVGNGVGYDLKTAK